MYVINYGKVLDWMASPKICLYIMIAPILIGAEVFGLQALPFFVVSVAFSRLFNHGRSIYPQRGNSGVSGGENGNIRPSSEKD